MLQPASVDDFRRELTACLALCAPAGFDERTRQEWLRTAWATLQGVPADLLVRGCRVARTYCDHPSKIVPTIMREVEEPWKNRKSAYGKPSTAPRIEAPKADPDFVPVTPEQMAAIKAEFGLATNPYPDAPKPVGVAPRMPTRADYIAMGVDASILDRVVGKAA